MIGGGTVGEKPNAGCWVRRGGVRDTATNISHKTYNLTPDRKRIQDILHGKAQLLDYDAICTFVFPDWLCLAKFMYDEDCKALAGDHENFMDEGQMKMMVGDEYVLVEGGEKVVREEGLREGSEKGKERMEG